MKLNSFLPKLISATDYSETSVISVVIGAVTHITINSVNPVAAIVTFIIQRINTAATKVPKVLLLPFSDTLASLDGLFIKASGFQKVVIDFRYSDQHREKWKNIHVHFLFSAHNVEADVPILCRPMGIEIFYLLLLLVRVML